MDDEGHEDVAKYTAAQLRQGGRLGIRSLDEFESERQTWLWEAMIPTGTLTVLAGPGGTSKSTLAIGLAAMLSRGALPGAHCGTPAGVLYLTRENDLRKVVNPRFEAAGADRSRIGVLGAEEIRLPDDVAELMRYAESCDVRLIVLDTLSAFTSAGLGSYGGAAKGLLPLIDECSRRGIAIVGIHHTVKGKKKPTVDAVLGSTGLTSTARQVLLVGHVRDDAVVGVVKSNVGHKDHGWVYGVASRSVNEEIDAPAVSLVRPAFQDEIGQMYDDRATGGGDDRLMALLEYVGGAPDVDTTTVRAWLMEQFEIRERSAEKVILRAIETALVTRTRRGRAGTLRSHLNIAAAGEAMLSES